MSVAYWAEDGRVNDVLILNRLDYLTNVLGFDLHTAQEIIKQR